MAKETKKAMRAELLALESRVAMTGQERARRDLLQDVLYPASEAERGLKAQLRARTPQERAAAANRQIDPAIQAAAAAGECVIVIRVNIE